MKKQFDRMNNGSWYTIVGVGGNEEKWKEDYERMLREVGIGEIKEWCRFTGKDMNDEYNLHGSNRYPSNLVFLAFSLDGLNIPKLAFFKLIMKDRWFDDIISNDKARERNNVVQQD